MFKVKSERITRVTQYDPFASQLHIYTDAKKLLFFPAWLQLQSIALTGENTSCNSGVVVHNALACSLFIVRPKVFVFERWDKGERGTVTHISTTTQHKQSHQNQKHVQHKTPNTSNPPARDPPRAIISPSHPHIRCPPEDETEEGIEQRTHQTEQIREERNDFCDDEG